MKRVFNLSVSILLGLLILTFNSCSDDEPEPSPTAEFTVGGTVTGASGALVLVLGNEELTVSEDGDFVFATKLATGNNYTVTVKSAPSGQTAAVSNGTGTINTANVTNVAVTCEDLPLGTFAVGGTISGLTGTLVIANNGVDELTLTENGSFTFGTPLADGSPYRVTIVTQPSGELCSIENASGTIDGGSVSNVTITSDAVPSIGTNYFVVDNADPAILYEFQPDKSLLAKSTNGFGTYDFVAGLAYDADNDITYAFAAGSQKLLSVNRSTGVATELADLITTEIYDLAYDKNADILYAVNWLDGTLQSINVSTGAITDIATDISLTRVYGLAYDAGNDILYATKSGGGVGQVVKINTTTGVATLVGENAFLFSGLAYDQANNVLYGAQGDDQDDRLMDLYEISTSDGSATNVGPTGLSSITDGGMTYVDSDGQLIASWGDGFGKIYEVDETTGTTTSIGSSGYPEVVGMAFCDADLSIYGLAGGVINSLVTYNPESGESTYKVEVDLMVGIINTALTYDDEADDFYTIVMDSNEDLHLASIDRTTGVGDTRASIFDDKIFALAYNKEANILYGATNNNIAIIETSSGIVLSEVDIDGLRGDITAMNFDPAKKVLVAVTDSKEVFAINPISGEVSQITETTQVLFAITLKEQ